MKDKQFPVLWQGSMQYIEALKELDCPRSVPWDFIAEHEDACLSNHNQSTELLASRGGLGPGEMIAVINGTKNWKERVAAYNLKPEESIQKLKALLAEWNKKHNVNQAGVALIIKDGLILSISRRDNKKLFGLPGGKFDSEVDLDTKDTAIRETREETSIIVKDCTLIFERIDSGFQARCYYVLEWEGTPINSEEGEVRWLNSTDLTSSMAAFSEYNTKTLEVFRLLYPNVEIK